MRLTAAALLLMALLGGCNSDSDPETDTESVPPPSGDTSNDNNGGADDDGVPDDTPVDDDSNDGSDDVPDDAPVTDDPPDDSDGGTNDDSANDDGEGLVTATISKPGIWRSSYYQAPYRAGLALLISPRGVFVLQGQEAYVNTYPVYMVEAPFSTIGYLEGHGNVEGEAYVVMDPAHDEPDRGEYHELIKLSGQFDSAPSTVRFSSEYLLPDIDYVFDVYTPGETELMSVEELRQRSENLEKGPVALAWSWTDDNYVSFPYQDVHVLDSPDSDETKVCTVTMSLEPFGVPKVEGYDFVAWDMIQEDTDCEGVENVVGMIIWNRDDLSIFEIHFNQKRTAYFWPFFEHEWGYGEDYNAFDQ